LDILFLIAMNYLNPFSIFPRILIASFKIVGYFLSYGTQAAWHFAAGNRSHVGDAIGNLGRGITDAIAEVFYSRR